MVFGRHAQTTLALVVIFAGAVNADRQAFAKPAPNPRYTQVWAEAASGGVNYIEFTMLDEYRGALDAFRNQWAVSYVMSHRDARAYLMLTHLRTTDPDAYERIPASVRARILCGGLASAKWHNDWGHIGREPYHGDSATALLECGASAVGCLWPLLRDRRPAKLSGSEDATSSVLHRYRKCDFAFHFVSVLTHRSEQWHEKLYDRDLAINAYIRQHIAAQPTTKCSGSSLKSRGRLSNRPPVRTRPRQPRHCREDGQ